MDTIINRIDDITQNISDKISKSTYKLISDCYQSKGEKYVIASIEYAEKNAKTHFDPYLQETLRREWAIQGFCEEPKL
ncbi:MAG: hypothetical protein ACK5Z5_05035 [Neisseriaceae bacterium]